MSTDTRATEIADLLARLAVLMADHSPTPPPVPASRQMPKRVLLTVEETAEQLNIGRTLVYRLIREGAIDSIRIGRLRRVPFDAVQSYARQLIDTAEPGTAA